MAKSSSVVKASDAVVSPVDPDQTLKASKALLAHIKKAAKEQSSKAIKKSLLDSADSDGAEDGSGTVASVAETPVWLTLTTKRHIHDSTRLQPGKIVLPHPLHDLSSATGAADDDLTICLITADPQRAYKNIVASEAFPEALRRRVTRVVDLTHLKAKFKSYEAQRQLASEHEVFLADDRIINRLPKALGKSFYKSTAKRPVPIVLAPPRERVDGKRVKAEPKKWGQKKAGANGEETPGVNARPAGEIAAEIEKAVGAALVHLSQSTNTAVKIGYAGWSADKIAANAQAVAAALVDKFVPQKWANVRSIYIKGPETAALPVWMTEELWLDGQKDVLPDGAPEPKGLPNSGQKTKVGEKPNVGKKRKSLGDEPENVNGAEERKAKKSKTAKALPAGDDDKLDKQIAERKEKLKKQKKAAKKSMEA